MQTFLSDISFIANQWEGRDIKVVYSAHESCQEAMKQLNRATRRERLGFYGNGRRVTKVNKPLSKKRSGHCDHQQKIK